MKTLRLGALLVAATVGMAPVAAHASSHREAPLMLEDPAVDATDLYAFRNGANVVIVANYIPFEAPAGGPNFHRLSDNAVYRINIDNNGDAVADIVYEFRFTTTVANTSTFLYNGVPNAMGFVPNVRQTYTVTRIAGGTPTVITSAPVEAAPAYVGRHTFTPLPSPMMVPPPGNQTTSTAGDTAYDAYVTAHNIGTLTGGGQVFVGPRDDPFFVDLGAIFDMLRVRPFNLATSNVGQLGGGVDYVSGFNTHAIVLEVPITQLAMGGTAPSDPAALNAILGVWTTAHRPRVRVIRASNTVEHHGQMVQVSRLGYPLVNEVLVPLGFKDFFLGSQPASDAMNYGAALMNNEPTRLLNALYFSFLPGMPTADVAMVGGNLISLISGALIRPAGATGTLVPADILRLNVAVPANPFPTPGSNATLGAFAPDAAGFPNGRRLSDDVADIELRVLAGALANRGAPPHNIVGDGVPANDRPFTATFPYLARPFEGYDGTQYTNRLAPSGPRS